MCYCVEYSDMLCKISPMCFGFPQTVLVLQGSLADPRALAVTLADFQ